MNDPRTMLVWTLRSWPKAQYLARALGIPADAWEIPFLFVAIGGPEISAFEAMERPELGGLTTRLKALTKPLAAAAYEDPWVSATILAASKLAVAFHPGISLTRLRELSERDGYIVSEMSDALRARGEVEVAADWQHEGLLDWHGRLRNRWRDEDDALVIAQTLAEDAWESHQHSAAYYLASRPENWEQIFKVAIANERDVALRQLRELVLEDMRHPMLSKRFTALAADPRFAHVFNS